MASTLGRKPPGRPKDETLTSRRHEEILDAAARVFARLGFRNTDLQVIAGELGLAKGTLYRYFPSKQELFLAAVDQGMRRLQGTVDASCADFADPLARIAAAIRAYFGFFDSNPWMVELLIQERAEFKDRRQPTYFEHCESNIGPWEDMFRALIADGKMRNVPVERITDVLSNLVYGTMFTNYFAGRSKSLEAQTEDILDILFNGILTG